MQAMFRQSFVRSASRWSSVRPSRSSSVVAPTSLVGPPLWTTATRSSTSRRDQSTLTSQQLQRQEQRRDNANQQQITHVYVHQTSKSVLEYLQSQRHEWLQQAGLDRGLRINTNGTFVLQYPSRPGHDAGRIWTSYDAVTKQHWLSVYRGKLKTRFLLKDSLTDAATVEDLITRAVDAMIAKLSK